MMNSTSSSEAVNTARNNQILDKDGHFLSTSLTSARGMVIAIRTPHSRAILDGEKEIEFRRTHLKTANPPEVGLIYEPAPTKSIIGTFHIEKVEHHSVDELWKLARRFTPSTKDGFYSYFEGKESGSAIHIDKASELNSPISLHSNESSEWAFTPPQNFYYVELNEFINHVRGD